MVKKDINIKLSGVNDSFLTIIEHCNGCKNFELFLEDEHVAPNGDMIPLGALTCTKVNTEGGCLFLNEELALSCMTTMGVVGAIGPTC